MSEGRGRGSGGWDGVSVLRGWLVLRWYVPSCVLSCLRSCVRFVACSRVSCPGLRFWTSLCRTLTLQSSAYKDKYYTSGIKFGNIRSPLLAGSLSLARSCEAVRQHVCPQAELAK